MRSESYPQIAVVRKGSAAEFQEAFNSKILELADYKITGQKIEISGNVFTAVITYEVTRHIVDSVSDEFHAQGIRYLCKHCPHLEDPKDRRVKYCICRYSETGMAHKDHEACEVFYRELKLGKIEPLEDYER